MSSPRLHFAWGAKLIKIYAPAGTARLYAFMGKRKNSRTKMVLPLRVWGTDATGKTFMLMAHTLDVSPTGARLQLSAPSLDAPFLVLHDLHSIHRNR